MAGAEEALFFTHGGDEDDRVIEAPRRHHPRQFQDDGDAGCVVIGAGGVAFAVHRLAVARVVVAHDIAALGLSRGFESAGQFRDDIDEFGLLVDAPAVGRRDEGLESHAHRLLARSSRGGGGLLELRLDPAPRRPDPPRGRVRGREGVPGAERDERFDVRLDPRGRNLAQHRADLAVPGRRHRRNRGPGLEGRTGHADRARDQQARDHNGESGVHPGTIPDSPFREAPDPGWERSAAITSRRRSTARTPP